MHIIIFIANVASKGGLANRQLPSGKKSHSNSSSDCGLDESEDEPNELLPTTVESTETSPYTNGHYRQQRVQPQQQQQQPQPNTSPLYAQVNKDRDSNKNDQHATIPNIYRGLHETTSHGSYASELNSSYDSIVDSNDKLSEGIYTESNWSSSNQNNRTRPKGFKMPFAEELTQVLAESKG